MISEKKRIERIFDSIADRYVDAENKEGGVIMAVYSEEEKIGFHAAHGEIATITALITAIIEHTARNANMLPLELAKLIEYGLIGAMEDE